MTNPENTAPRNPMDALVATEPVDARREGFPLAWLADPVAMSAQLTTGVSAILYTLAANRGHGWHGVVTPNANAACDTLAELHDTFTRSTMRPVDTAHATPVVEPAARPGNHPGARRGGDGGWRVGPSPVTVHPLRDRGRPFGYRCAAEASRRSVGSVTRSVGVKDGYLGSIAWAVNPNGTEVGIVALVPHELAPGAALCVSHPGETRIRRVDGRDVLRHEDAEGQPVSGHTLVLGVAVATAVVCLDGTVAHLRVEAGCTVDALDGWLEAVSEAVWAARNPDVVRERAMEEKALREASGRVFDAAVGAATEVDAQALTSAWETALDRANAAWMTVTREAERERLHLMLRLMRPATTRTAFTPVGHAGEHVRVGVVVHAPTETIVYLDDPFNAPIANSGIVLR